MLRPVAIEKVWNSIEPVALAFLTDPSENSAEDIRKACESGGAVCLECPDGYIISEIRINRRTGLRELYLRWGSRVNDEVGCFERVLPDLQMIAQAMRCANIVFGTKREGWLRKAKKSGFIVRNIELVRAV